MEDDECTKTMIARITINEEKMKKGMKKSKMERYAKTIIAGKYSIICT